MSMQDKIFLMVHNQLLVFQGALLIYGGKLIFLEYCGNSIYSVLLVKYRYQ